VKVLVLVLVLRCKVLVLVLTKKAWSWSSKISEVLVLVLVLKKSLIYIFALWPNNWMDQDAIWYGVRSRPRPHCVIWGPSLPQKSGHSPYPNFRPMSVVAKRSPISATAEHLFYYGRPIGVSSCNGRPTYFRPVILFLPSSFFFSLPILSRRKLNVYHILPHMM